MEWIVKECVETAGCKLEVSAAFVGEDVLGNSFVNQGILGNLAFFHGFP